MTGSFLLRRLLSLLASVAIISVVTFLIIHLIPGDPARLVAGLGASEQDVESIRTELGLDRPLPVQYVDWVGRALQGDLGRSLRTRAPVVEEIAKRLPATLELAAAGMLIALIVGVAMGMTAATRPGSWIDNLTMSLSVVGVSTPIFMVGLLFMLLFAVQLPWLPSSGRGTPLHLILPALTLSVTYIGTLGRLTRSSMLEVMGEDYVRTARSKGVSPRVARYRHALRNALIPIVTIAGLHLGRLFGGAVVTETIFAWPGLGRLLVDAIAYRDIYLVQGTILVFGVLIVLVNTLVDLITGWLDPRIRLN